MQRKFTSTDILALMAQHNFHIVVERAGPDGELTEDFVTVRNAHGSPVELSMTNTGYSYVELPNGALEGYLRQGYVRPEGKDRSGNDRFVLTEDGKRVGRDIKLDEVFFKQ